MSSTLSTIKPFLVASGWTWAGATGPLDLQAPINFEERFGAVIATKWEGIGLLHADVNAIRQHLGFKEFGTMCKTHGIKHIEVELLTGWWLLNRTYRELESTLFQAAHELDASYVKVSPRIHRSRARERPDRAFLNALKQLVERAKDASIRIALEPMAMSNVPDLQSARDVLDSLHSHHLGLVIDTWHLGACGVDPTDIFHLVDRSEICAVELSGILKPDPSKLRESSANRRTVPNKGDIPIKDYVSALLELGWKGPWGVEVMSASHADKSLTDFLRSCKEAAAQVITQAASNLP